MPVLPPSDCSALKEVMGLHDCAPSIADFRDALLEGLQSTPKFIPCKYFYDAAGSRLFDQICELPEYYPTRTERQLLCKHGPEIAAALGPRSLLIEYGSGSSSKTTILLDSLQAAGLGPAAYVPIDISREHLLHSAARLAAAYAPMPVLPVCADYSQPFDLPLSPVAIVRRVVFFPGSTIGNFEPAAATQFLQGMAQLCGPGGGLLIGVDTKKDAGTLHRAYNDSLGVTAAFNLNVLERLNRELGAAWPIEDFAHVALYNEVHGRIEMHLECRRRQTLSLAGHSIDFAAGERIHTEYSYKYDPKLFARLAFAAGWTARETWIDDEGLFSLHYLDVAVS